jgi:hypothetical protein
LADHLGPRRRVNRRRVPRPETANRPEAARGPETPGPAHDLSASSDQSSKVEEALLQYLELRIGEIRDAAADREKSGQRDKLKLQVGQMFTRVGVLGLYALVLGITFQPLLLGALFDPAQVAARMRTAASSLTLIQFVPPEYRATLIAACGALFLLIFRSTPLGVRFGIGGILFMGVVALSLLGMAVAAGAGFLGTVAGLVGIVAAIVIVYELNMMLQRASGVSPSATIRAEAIEARAAQRLAGSIDWVGRRVRVVDSLPGRIVFLAVPVLAIVLVGTAAFLEPAPGTPLYVASWIAQRGFVLWCLWAFAVTPSTVRIPLWSLLVWGFVFATLFSFGIVSFVYAAALLATVLINVVLLILPSRTAY